MKGISYEGSHKKFRKDYSRTSRWVDHSMEEVMKQRFQRSVYNFRNEPPEKLTINVLQSQETIARLRNISRLDERLRLVFEAYSENELLPDMLAIYSGSRREHVCVCVCGFTMVSEAI